MNWIHPIKDLIHRKWRLQSRFLYWPLKVFEDRVAATRYNGLLKKAAAETRYPFRAMRYWWVGCALADEAARCNRPLRVVDAGCSRGQIKTYVGDDPRLRWFGIDWRVDEPELLDLGYEKVYQYDFDRPLPLEDESFDVVVFLHVIEHLPRPAFTLAELARILRPGGIILAGSPIAPVLVARIRQWQHVRDFQKGVRKPGQHIHSFWPGRWRALAASTGLSLELFNGAFFSRWSGSPLENQWWWVRLNQLWGALFPALGAELYLVGRKAAGFHAETEP